MRTTAPAKPESGCEGFGLEGVDLLRRDGAAVEELLGRRDLFGRRRTRGRPGYRLDVLGLRRPNLLLLLQLTLRHGVTAGDEVHEDAQERQEDDEQYPEGLGPTAQVTAAEHVAE